VIEYADNTKRTAEEKKGKADKRRKKRTSCNKKAEAAARPAKTCQKKTI